MASGPVGGGFARSRSLLRFLSIDPEIYPLVGVLGAITAFAGYTASHKVYTVDPDRNVLKASHAYPWQHQHSDSENGKNANYKYRYHQHGDPSQPAFEAPSAITEHKIKIKAPKELFEKIPSTIIAEEEVFIINKS
ncbi:21085_t:CDS:2 [Dentiscutata erythropus]|uniref:21085_t:CDS:1 n=1 Tax=Dentiscutata erythropus TaxID=1348616 RepID=A0A9N9CHU1_9GLOM|nr:21085_t:CDS:2 [Dentiscutata erythropus]